MACPSSGIEIEDECSNPCNTVYASRASPSSSTATAEYPNNNYCFDVFINHRGPDVKKTLASHLYNVLISYGFRVFLDQHEFQEGHNLTSQIEGAIASASAHIAIFSPRYAESKWCLDELLLMLNTDATIIPVFYGVKPAELRWTRGKDGLYSRVLRIIQCWSRAKDGVYAQALLNLEKKTTFDPKTHKKKPRYEPNTIQNWRKALSRVADISGFELEACHGDEGELVNKIVERVQEKVRKTPLHVATYPTGLLEKVDDLEKRVLMEQQSRKAQVVGIVGLGGIGKTTVAKEFYNRRRTYYHASCFLFDIREAAGKGLLPSLHTQLLKDLRKLSVPQISSIDQGIGILKCSLSSTQALVLDDVDHASQMDALFLPLKDVLCPGSLILVTSRNKDILTVSGIVESSIYKITGLDIRHSQELFCSHVFHQPHPCVGFEEAVPKFVHACDGLPLSLKVIGALLQDKKDLKYWKAQLSKISNILPFDIQTCLK